MNIPNKNNQQVSENKIILYTDKHGNIELRADIKKDTMWATQAQIATIFEVDFRTISEHLKNIFKTAELTEKSVLRKFRNTGPDNKQYLTKFYNLDAIIAVGYRVNSKKATQFRIWATTILRNYLVTGRAINEPVLAASKEKLDGLREVITLLESPVHKGRLKGKITLKVTKELVE